MLSYAILCFLKLAVEKDLIVLKVPQMIIIGTEIHHQNSLRWWFQILNIFKDFVFSPRSLGRWSQFDDHIFQLGLVQPPTISPLIDCVHKPNIGRICACTAPWIFDWKGRRVKRHCAVCLQTDPFMNFYRTIWVGSGEETLPDIFWTFFDWIFTNSLEKLMVFWRQFGKGKELQLQTFTANLGSISKI